MKALFFFVLICVMLGTAPMRYAVAQELGVQPVSVSAEAVANMRAVGIANTPNDADINIYVLADISETGLSGAVLSKQLREVASRYGDRVKLWYVHFLLAYRESRADVLVTSGCLGEQGAFWTNIDALIANDARPYPPLGIYPGIGSPERYADCVANTNNATNKMRRTTHRDIAATLLAAVGSQGIPTTVFIKGNDTTHALMLPGAYPASHFLAAVETLSSGAYPTPVPSAGPALAVPMPSPVRPMPTGFAVVAASFIQFIKTLASYWPFR